MAGIDSRKTFLERPHGHRFQGPRLITRRGARTRSPVSCILVGAHRFINRTGQPARAHPWLARAVLRAAGPARQSVHLQVGDHASTRQLGLLARTSRAVDGPRSQNTNRILPCRTSETWRDPSLTAPLKSKQRSAKSRAPPILQHMDAAREAYQDRPCVQVAPSAGAHPTIRRTTFIE
jgi:hypothetical protein